MSTRTTINELLNMPEIEQINEYGVWFDWFCPEDTLVDRGRNLINRLKEISLSSKINGDKQYVFFKNNITNTGMTYDDMRICDIDTGEVVYTIIPEIPVVYGKENKFIKPLVTGNWTDVINWFLV